jgi:hypothetical protein
MDAVSLGQHDDREWRVRGIHISRECGVYIVE